MSLMITNITKNVKNIGEKMIRNIQDETTDNFKLAILLLFIILPLASLVTSSRLPSPLRPSLYHISPPLIMVCKHQKVS